MLAQSAPNPTGLEPLRTQITVNESIQAESPAALTIIGKTALRRMPGLNVDDRLRLVPGFTLLRRSSSIAANPTTQGISLRGIGSSGASRTLVLSDGMPLNDPFGGWVYWTRIAPESIEQTEVSRGATTGLFGDRALGGAIQFTSATPSTENLILSTEAGNKGTVTPFGSYTNLFKQRVGITVALRAASTDGYYIVPDSIRGSIDTPAGVRFIAPQWKLDYLRGTQRFSLRGDILVEERQNGTRLQTNSTALGSVGGSYSRSTADSAVSVLMFRQQQQFHASFSALAADRNSERLTANQSVPSAATGGAAYLNRKWDAVKVIAGADFLRVNGTSTDYLFPAGRRTGGGNLFARGVFVQADSEWKGIRFFGGSRAQWTGLQSGSFFYSPSGGLAWGRRWFRMRASAYRSFRAPTLNELFREFRAGNTSTLPNTGLRPEVLAGVETGADIVLERWRLSVTAYRNSLTDLITNVTLSSTPNLITRQRQNAAGALARGVEASLAYRRGSWLFDTSYLLADSRFFSGERVPQVARQQGSVQATWQKNSTQLGIGLRSTSLQFEDDRNSQLLPGYAIFHASFLQSLGRGFSFTGALENAFDRVYLSGFTPQPQIAAPRLWRVGLRWQGRPRV